MIRVHIGMPRVGFRDFDFRATDPKAAQRSNTFIVPSAVFRKEIRPIINSNLRSQSAFDSLPLQRSVKEWMDFNAVAISQHALLGDPGKLLLSRRARRRAALRLDLIRKLFRNHPISFHLMLTNPLEYLFRVFAAEAERIIDEFGVFSWAALIEEIGLLDPEDSLVLWNCDGDWSVLKRFLCDFADCAESEAIELYGKSRHSRFQNSAETFHAIPQRIKLELGNYVVTYRDELVELGKSSFVTVVGAS